MSAKSAGRDSAGGDAGQRWRGHPYLSFLIRALVLLTPAVASALVSFVVSRALPVPTTVSTTALWWAVLLGSAIGTWLVCGQLLRRLLPLAALLNLSILFPDAAPSRFAVARRTANPRRLEEDLAHARLGRPGEGPAQRAETILALVTALSAHDRRTRGHSERVRLFTDLLAEEMHLSTADRDRLQWAALLHDIGKLVVPAELLNKKAAPDGSEWEVLRRHPLEGERLIAPLRPWMGEWGDAVTHHHEKFDGSGYPLGLRGQQISLGGRLVAVADCYETMTAARPYKTPMTVVAAREELVRMSGTHFDPVVVRAFLNISVGRLWRAVGVGALVAEAPLIAPIVAALGRATRAPAQGASAVAAAGLAAVLVATGVAGIPTGPSPRGGEVLALTANAAGLPAEVQPAAEPAPGAAPADGSSATGMPPAVGGTLAASVGAPAPAPGSPPAATTSPGNPPPGAGSYPPGIARQQPHQPPGVAKNPSAFTNWRKHH